MKSMTWFWLSFIVVFLTVLKIQYGTDVAIEAFAALFVFGFTLWALLTLASHEKD